MTPGRPETVPTGHSRMQLFRARSIIQSMRHLLLALLVALLPLRGWVGDAMATGMLTEQLTAAHATAPNAADATGSESAAHKSSPAADCHGHEASAEESDSSQHNCTACNLCHSVAFAPEFSEWQPTSVPAKPPLSGSRSYASADIAAGLKPPIS